MTDAVLELWVPRRGLLKRATTAELPIADMSMFGASVWASPSEKIQRGKVVEIALEGSRCLAIVRSERPGPEPKGPRCYGLEFVQPAEDFLQNLTRLMEHNRRSAGVAASRQEAWVRTS